MKSKIFILIPLMFIFLSEPLFCEEVSDCKESDTIEFPQWALYARRTEIVTLGSLPFTTLGVTLGFGAYKYFSGATNSFPNPFDKSSSSYSENDIKTIIGISISISLVIGIVDLIINIVKHNNESKRLGKIIDTSSIITIVPATEEEINGFKNSGSGQKKSEVEDETESVESENISEEK